MKSLKIVTPILLSLTLLFAYSSAAVCQMLYRQTTETQNTLNAIFFETDSLGMAVGASGTVMTTANAGLTWTTQPTGIQSDFYCMNFNDLSNGIIAGDNGILFAYINAKPLMVQLPEAKPIYSIAFPTYDTAVVVGGGGLIYKTNDSGRSWYKINPPAVVSGRDFHGTEYFDDSTYWVVGSGGIVLYTEDAGTTWQRINVNTTSDLYSISFPDESDNGWIVGDHIILYTTDAGDTWTQAPTSGFLRNVVGYDSLHAFATGLSGTLLTTNDLKDWSSIETGTTANLYGFDIPDSFYVTGDSGLVLTNLPPPTKPVLTLTVTPVNDFGIVGEGLSKEDTLTILQNTSVSGSITITGISIDSAEFTSDLTSNAPLPFSLATGETHTLHLIFTPTYAGNISSGIHVVTAEAGTASSQLKGTGAININGVSESATNAGEARFIISNDSKQALCKLPAEWLAPKLDIYNILGEKMLSTSLTDTRSVDLGFLIEGTYFYRISSANGSASGKFILR